MLSVFYWILALKGRSIEIQMVEWSEQNVRRNLVTVKKKLLVAGLEHLYTKISSDIRSLVTLN